MLGSGGERRVDTESVEKLIEFGIAPKNAFRDATKEYAPDAEVELLRLANDQLRCWINRKPVLQGVRLPGSDSENQPTDASCRLEAIRCRCAKALARCRRAVRAASDLIELRVSCVSSCSTSASISVRSRASSARSASFLASTSGVESLDCRTRLRTDTFRFCARLTRSSARTSGWSVPRRCHRTVMSQL